MIAEIKQLNPKPGLKFGSVQIQPVLPDVHGARRRATAAGLVELNNDTLPRVLVNRSYYTTVTKTARSEKDAATCSTACRTPTGWSRASTSGRAPSCAWPRRSCASRTAS